MLLSALAAFITLAAPDHGAVGGIGPSPPPRSWAVLWRAQRSCGQPMASTGAFASTAELRPRPATRVKRMTRIDRQAVIIHGLAWRVRRGQGGYVCAHGTPRRGTAGGRGGTCSNRHRAEGDGPLPPLASPVRVGCRAGRAARSAVDARAVSSTTRGRTTLAKEACGRDRRDGRTWSGWIARFGNEGGGEVAQASDGPLASPGSRLACKQTSVTEQCQCPCQRRADSRS